ncbi:uncharacterized protein ASPGLDRAFT_1367204 [Aspergillus glaucus CBS 516.65]|uniref:Uncharacterized protein n=1 Tax=Aspergillus glaucus CBS 516.65 TaxID=1160497 RepID=A0A1L9VNW0_ASPGL|nr:hypothetical protein ASPGLDRAFT_1367204 [Aspergillus glaucus CBS 516.65]OJJ85582.1 hypothetical protein ASPGLDRAFT_1367204 [Aspergillus glaucus CBS 516.65]
MMNPLPIKRVFSTIYISCRSCHARLRYHISHYPIRVMQTHSISLNAVLGHIVCLVLWTAGYSSLTLRLGFVLGFLSSGRLKA